MKARTAWGLFSVRRPRGFSPSTIAVIIESVNAAGRKIFGYTADEMLGRNVSMVLPVPFDGQTSSPDIKGTIREASGRRKDGSMFPIDLAVTEVVLADRRIFTGFVRDITERKQAEQMQREFGKQLLQAQEAERARLARELHDDITQRLGVLAINADRLDSEARPDRATENHTWNP